MECERCDDKSSCHGVANKPAVDLFGQQLTLVTDQLVNEYAGAEGGPGLLSVQGRSNVPAYPR